MTEIGRNSPCPCGSGKKYKRCCLAGDRLDDRRWQGLDLAMDWLLQHYGEKISEELFDRYWGSVGGALMARLDELPEEVELSLRENSDEWLVAQGRVRTNGKSPVPVIDVLLASGGPPFDDVQRRWLRSFTENSLGIYEIQEVRPLEMIVRDLADTYRPPLRIVGRAIPPEADEPSALIAMRLLPEDDHWIRTIAWYPFERSLLARIKEAITQARDECDDLQDRRWHLGSLLAELWWEDRARAHLSAEEIAKARSMDLQS